MKPGDANFAPDPADRSGRNAESLDSVAATLAAERERPWFYRSLIVRCAIVAAYLLANVLSFAIVRQGLITMQTFSHVGWLTGGVFETLLAVLIQAALAFFALMFNDRIRGWSSRLTWTAALFAIMFWGAEFYFGALTQSLGSFAPEALKQMETRAARLQTEIDALAGDIAAEYRRQVDYNRREAANEERGFGLTRLKGCFDRCKEFQGRAMELERRFGMLGMSLPPAAGDGDINTTLIDAQTRLKLLDERAALLPHFGTLAQAIDKEQGFIARLAEAKREYGALTKMLEEHSAVTPRALAADHAAVLIKRLVYAEFERIAAHEWVIVFYSAVFIAANWFLALLLAIYNRNGSPTGLKARRARELNAGAAWDREVAEGEAQAQASAWIERLRANFWSRMAR